jgi:hypothetical protein
MTASGARETCRRTLEMSAYCYWGRRPTPGRLHARIDDPRAGLRRVDATRLPSAALEAVQVLHRLAMDFGARCGQCRRTTPRVRTLQYRTAALFLNKNLAAVHDSTSVLKQQLSLSAHGGRFEPLKRRGANKKEQEDAFDDYHKVVRHFGCSVGRDAGICGTGDAFRYS